MVIINYSGLIKTMQERTRFVLSLCVQSDENLNFKVFEVTKSENLLFDVLDKFIGSFQFSVEIKSVNQDLIITF